MFYFSEEIICKDVWSKKIKDEFLSKLNEKLNLIEINQIKSDLFGKHGLVSSQFKKIGAIAENERKKFASDLNLIKDELQDLIDYKIDQIQKAEIETFTFLPLVSLVLFCLLIILILVTLTLNIFSMLVFKFFLFALDGTLKTILFCSDKLVDFSVTSGEIILSYRCIIFIVSISFLVLLLNFL